jgi:hypothetical protein
VQVLSHGLTNSSLPRSGQRGGVTIGAEGGTVVRKQTSMLACSYANRRQSICRYLGVVQVQRESRESKPEVKSVASGGAMRACEPCEAPPEVTSATSSRRKFFFLFRASAANAALQRINGAWPANCPSAAMQGDD